MKKIAIKMLTTWLGLLILTSSVQAEMVTRDQALTVANNWINLIIQKKGSWGDVNTAVVQDIQEFKRGERVIGYFCQVKPTGFIVISLHKELAPVKAYSPTSSLDPETDQGMADFIKLSMEGTLNAIEKKLGPIKLIQTEDLQTMLEVEHQPMWGDLSYDAETFKAGLQSGVITMDYSEGQELLSSDWHQNPPYNDDCPDKNCSNLNGRAKVGCVATAAAQIMRYWAWPPRKDPSTGMYDWPNMLDEYVWDDTDNRFEDGSGNPCSQAQIDAVAKLCYEVGKAAGTGGHYGCSKSTAWLGGKPNATDMTDAYEEHFRYDEDVDFEQRWHWSNDDWWDEIKDNLDDNRPLQYGIIDLSIGGGFASHSMVVDGWQEVGSTRYCHMNYGWPGTSSDILYNINNLPDSDFEGMIRNIYPSCAEGPVISGHHEPFLPFAIGRKYFDQDASNRWFLGYNDASYTRYNCQFLPRVTVTCGGATETIEFIGTELVPSRLYSIKGTKVAGVRIYNGSIKLYENGSIRFH